MSRDIRKNGVDEKLENHDNIIDFEGFTTEYTADEEFEKLIGDGLDKSWEDLGLTVDDALIARTMSAIRDSADEKHELPAGMITPAAGGSAEKTFGEGMAKTVGTASGADSRRAKVRRFTRIAAGIAAALLMGVIGISVIRGGVGMKSMSSNSANDAAYESGGSSGAESVHFSTNYEAAKATDNSGYDLGDANEGDTFSDVKIVTSSGAGDALTDMTASDEATESVSEDSYEPGAVSPANDGEPAPTSIRNNALEKSEENEDSAPRSTDACAPDGIGYYGGDTADSSDEFFQDDSNVFFMEDENLQDQIVEYIESVEGDLISGGAGFGNRTDDAGPLITIAWFTTEDNDSEGGYSPMKEYYYTIFADEMDYHTGLPYSSNLNDYYTETRVLANGNEVAEHLRQMIDSHPTE